MSMSLRLLYEEVKWMDKKFLGDSITEQMEYELKRGQNTAGYLSQYLRAAIRDWRLYQEDCRQRREGMKGEPTSIKDTLSKTTDWVQG